MDKKTDLIRSSFDKWAPSWDDNEGWNENVLSFLIDLLPQGPLPKVMDLACGTGIMSKRLFDRYQGEVIGLDLSPKMLEVAKKKYEGNPRIKFQEGDFYEYEGDGFDLILLHNGYPHFLDVDGLCEKAYSVLKEGGILAIMHSCGREELNKHHEKSANPISFSLSSPKEEATKFQKRFILLKEGESEAFYYFILKRK